MPRLFAIVPAAGRSRRMGEPKLLLPVQGQSVIRRLLAALEFPDVSACIVVMRSSDAALYDEVNATSATILQPEDDPPDMRTSVELALQHVRREFSPDSNDGWILVPADHPVLNRDILHTLMTAWKATPTAIFVPTHEGRRGHPTIFPWRMADAVAEIPSDAGLNTLLQRNRDCVVEFAVNDPCVVTDLDTPEDFERVLKSYS